MEGAKLENQKSVSFPSEDFEPVVYVLFKCDKCTCVNCFFEDEQEVQNIQLQGFGLHFQNSKYSCNCPCHTGIGLLPRIKMMRRVIECPS